MRQWRQKSVRTDVEHRSPRGRPTVVLFVVPLDRLPRDWCAYCAPRIAQKALISWAFVVPGEGIEPPTNGLQNRCSTAELTRHIKNLYSAASAPPHGPEHCDVAGGPSYHCSRSHGKPRRRGL